MPKSIMSTSTEEYLEALYKLAREDRPVSTTTLSKQLNIAPASVTEMMQKLANADCVNYSPYRGVTLTSKGYRIAEKMTWKHRLLERFLNDVLKINREKLHEEACKMEHAVSDETTRAMCLSLNAPDKCPDDGQPIPPCDFDFSSCEECLKWGRNNPGKIGRRKNSVFSIAGLKENQEGLISFIRGNNKLLRKMLDLGLKPGAKVKIGRATSAEGPLEISVAGLRLPLDDEIANNVFVEKEPG
jgi:DtxR family Mn-dependent transcriptional regulator